MDRFIPNTKTGTWTECLAFFSKPNRWCRYFFLTVISVFLAIGLYQQFQDTINSDNAWLIIAAGRLLDGYRSLDFIYEPNFPFAYVFYIPVVWISHITSLPLYYASTVYFLLFVLMGFVANLCILSKWDFINRTDLIVILSAYLIGAIYFSRYNFGERDHLIALALCPFMLCQIALTKKWPLNRNVSFAVFLIGAILIMLKPHQGFLPAAMLLHRMISQRRLWIVKDPDFIILSLVTICNIAFMLMVFPDYVYKILPNVMAFYYKAYNPIWVSACFYSLICFVFLVLTFLFDFNRDLRTLITVFFIAAMLELAPYIAQMRGYTYHLMPYMIFRTCGAALAFSAILQKFTSRDFTLFLTGILFIVLIPLLRPFNFSYPSHDLYTRAEMPLAKIIAEDSSSATCPFYMLGENMGFIYQLSLYSGRIHASRFPAPWFLPKLYKTEQTMKSAYTEQKSLEFSDMVAEDFVRFRPCVVLINRFKFSDNLPFNFAGYFSRSEKFSDVWKNYEWKQTITINQGDYFSGTRLSRPHPLVYDEYIYKNRAEPKAAIP